MTPTHVSNVQPQDGAVLQYELNVSKNCSHGNHVSVDAVVAPEGNCYDLESMFLTPEKDDECGRNNRKATRCEVIEDFVIGGDKVCSLRCKCADSADYCQVHVYSSIKQNNIQICEVIVMN